MLRVVRRTYFHSFDLPTLINFEARHVEKTRRVIVAFGSGGDIGFYLVFTRSPRNAPNFVEC